VANLPLYSTNNVQIRHFLQRKNGKFATFFNEKVAKTLRFSSLQYTIKERLFLRAQ